LTICQNSIHRGDFDFKKRGIGLTTVDLSTTSTVAHETFTDQPTFQQLRRVVKSMTPAITTQSSFPEQSTAALLQMSPSATTLSSPTSTVGFLPISKTNTNVATITSSIATSSLPSSPQASNIGPITSLSIVPRSIQNHTEPYSSRPTQTQVPTQVQTLAVKTTQLSALNSTPRPSFPVSTNLAIGVNSGTAGKRSRGNTLLMVLASGLCVGVWLL
jgi:hypothetical protein